MPYLQSTQFGLFSALFQQYKYLYFMSQPNKTINKSFLAKFQGKTNKVRKSGIHDALNTSQNSKANKYDEQDSIDDHFKKIEQDILIPTNPEKIASRNNGGYLIKKRDSASNGSQKNGKKIDLIPLSYTPQIGSKEEILSPQQSPPSRSLSNSTSNSRGRYMFGKYLKLDKQALNHMQFLQSLQQKSIFQKSANTSLQIS